MADLVPGTIKTTSNTVTQTVQFAETVTAGEVVYKNSSSKYALADNSTSTLAAAAGIVLTGNATDEYGLIAISGDIDLGATLAIGTIYTVSSVGGALHPEADLLTTELLSIVGYGKTAALFQIDITNTGIAHA